jgi:hypothetical protein
MNNPIVMRIVEERGEFIYNNQKRKKDEVEERQIE